MLQDPGTFSRHGILALIRICWQHTRRGGSPPSRLRAHRCRWPRSATLTTGITIQRTLHGLTAVPCWTRGPLPTGGACPSSSEARPVEQGGFIGRSFGRDCSEHHHRGRCHALNRLIRTRSGS